MHALSNTPLVINVALMLNVGLRADLLVGYLGRYDGGGAESILSPARMLHFSGQPDTIVVY
jgi:hypothetical protein